MTTMTNKLIRVFVMAWTLLTPMLAAPPPPRSNNDMIHYQDDKYPFSAWYPKSWSKVPTTHVQTRLKAVSRNGEGGDDFNIVASYNEQAKSLTPTEYVSKISNFKGYLKMIEQTNPGAKIIAHGKTKLSSQDAYFFTCDVTHKSVGISVPMRQIQVFVA